MERKMGKKYIIVIILLIIIILGLVGYIFVSYNKDKCDVKISKNEVKEEEELVYLDIYSEKIQDLYNKIHRAGYCDSGMRELYHTGSVSLDNVQELGFYVGYMLLVEDKGVLNETGYKDLNKFTYDEINEKAKLVFGDSYNVKDQEYSVCPVYKYDSSTKTYTIDKENGCGCTRGPEGPITTLYKATQTGEQINIYTSVVHSKYHENGYYTYYKDPLYNQQIKTGCFESFSSKECVDSSTKYKFTFELEGKNYILTNITKQI